MLFERSVYLGLSCSMKWKVATAKTTKINHAAPMQKTYAPHQRKQLATSNQLLNSSVTVQKPQLQS